MTRLAFDIYPPDYPVTTTRLVRLTNQEYQAGTYYLHGRPMGTGQIVVDKDQAFVTATNFAVGNYVIVRDLDISEVSDSLNVLGGFYLEEGDFTLVSDDPKVLRFSGRSTISVLERAIMGPESLSPSEGPYSIEDGYWRWGSDTYGGVMRRALFEANYQTPPGLPMIETLTVGVDNIWWDDNDDSNGDPWPSFAGEFRTQCGTNLLELYRELNGYGVQLEIDARTFDVYAFNPDGYGTDRTSASFASGKVRFVAGVNIAADLTRKIHGRLRTTHLLVRTTDYPEGAWIESDDYTPGDPVYKRAYQSGDISGDPSLSTSLAARAQRSMDLRTLGEDAVRIPLSKPGDDEANGVYTPGPNFATGPTATTGHFWVGDLITLDTGDHTMDYADASRRVEAVEYVLREAGDWDVVVHLGPRAFLQNSSLPSLAGATSHTLPLELCRPGTIAVSSPSLSTAYADATEGDPNYTFGTTVDGSSDAALVVLVAHDEAEGPADISAVNWRWNGGTTTGQVAFSRIAGPTSEIEVWYLAAPQAGTAGATVHVDQAGDLTHVIGVAYVTGLTGSPFYRGTALATGTGTVASAPISTEAGDRVLTMGGQLENNIASLAAPTLGGGLTSIGTDTHDAAFGQRDGTMGFGHMVATGTTTTGTFTFNASRNWWAASIAFSGEGVGTVNDGHPDLIGTGTRAARCGHKHHVLRTAAPTVNDDWQTNGYPVTTLWTQVDDVDEPTTIVGTWLLVDSDAAGEAVWVEFGGGGHDDTDHDAFLTTIDGEGHTVNTVAASGTTETLDLANGNLHDVTLTDDCEFTFAGATNGVGCYLTLILRQDGTGSRTVTWPGSVEWPDGEAPVLSTAANAVDILSFLSRDGGTTWFGAFSGGVTAAQVQSIGRWEVVVSGNPATAVTTEDGSDWVYGWVDG